MSFVSTELTLATSCFRSLSSSEEGKNDIGPEADMRGGREALPLASFFPRNKLVPHDVNLLLDG